MVFPLLIGGAITLGLGYLARGSISEWMKTRQTEASSQQRIAEANVSLASAPEKVAQSIANVAVSQSPSWIDDFSLVFDKLKLPLIIGSGLLGAYFLVSAFERK